MLEIPERGNYSDITSLGLQGPVELQFLSWAELEHFTVQQLGAKCLLFAVEREKKSAASNATRDLAHKT